MSDCQSCGGTFPPTPEGICTTCGKDRPRPPCVICGKPASVSDGMIGADLCDRDACFVAAWDRAHEETA